MVTPAATFLCILISPSNSCFQLLVAFVNYLVLPASQSGCDTVIISLYTVLYLHSEALPMSPVVLLDLPIELLYTICAQFCAHCSHDSDLETVLRASNASSSLPSITRDISDTRALVNLSRSCHRLYQIAMPFIYHDFELSDVSYVTVAGCRLLQNHLPAS